MTGQHCSCIKVTVAVFNNLSGIAAMRLIALVVGALASSYIGWRILAVVSRSRAQDDKTAAAAKRSSANIHVLIFCFLGSAIGTVTWVDIAFKEGLYTVAQSRGLDYASLLFVLLASSRCVYCFVNIHSRFHP